MRKKMFKKIINLGIVGISLFNVCNVFANSVDNDFDKIPTNYNISLRVLDEAKRNVKDLDISVISANSCGINLDSSDVKIVKNANGATYDLILTTGQNNYDCLFPLKLKIIDTMDKTFPSGIVTLPLPDETVYNAVMLNAKNSVDKEKSKWSDDTIQQQKFPNGYNVYKIGVNVSVDIRADYQQKSLTAYSDNPRISVGNYFSGLVGYDSNSSYNEIDIDFSGRWTNERIIDVHPKEISNTGGLDLSVDNSKYDVKNMTNSGTTVSGSGLTGTGAKEDLFAEQFWKTTLEKYVTTDNTFNPYANEDKISFFGKILSVTHKKMLGGFTIYLTDMEGNVLQKTVSLENGTYFFFKEGLTANNKYNIVVKDDGQPAEYQVQYQGNTYPSFQKYGENLVFSGDSTETNIFLTAYIIKETTAKIVTQTDISTTALAIIIFFIFGIVIISYKFIKIYNSEKKKSTGE